MANWVENSEGYIAHVGDYVLTVKKEDRTNRKFRTYRWKNIGEYEANVYSNIDSSNFATYTKSYEEGMKWCENYVTNSIFFMINDLLKPNLSDCQFDPNEEHFKKKRNLITLWRKDLEENGFSIFP